jgi:hypothetical protein
MPSMAISLRKHRAENQSVLEMTVDSSTELICVMSIMYRYMDVTNENNAVAIFEEHNNR